MKPSSDLARREESPRLLEVGSKQLNGFVSGDMVAGTRKGVPPMAVYSHSKLETFQNCPLSYKFQYIDRIKTDRDSVEAFMGNCVHESLAKLYRDLKLSKLNTEDEIVEYYHQTWDRNWHDNVFVVRKDYSAEDYRVTGERGIREYYRRYAPFDQGKTVWIEQSVKVKLDKSGGYQLTGVVDRLVDVGKGRYEVHDYKTSGSLPSQERLDRDRQLALYQLAVHEYFSDAKDVDLVWHYLVFDKELRSKRTKEQLSELKKNVIDLIKTIEGTEVFEPRESELCEWCAYQEICPKRKHLFMVEALPPKKFKKDEGVVLADRYMSLREEEKRIKEEIEEVKAELGEYARQMGVEAVRGSGAVVNVKWVNKPTFPESGTPERKELERICAFLGRYEEVSILSTQKLASVVTKRLWSEKELSKIQPFVKWVESLEVRKGRSLRPWESD